MNLMTESRDVPLVRAARFDPPPTSVSKTLWVTRKVRVQKQIDAAAASTKITVDDIKAQSSSSAFKISKICVWTPGVIGAIFTLGEPTWAQDTTSEIAYVDISPPGRMPGVSFNIPDQLSTMLNTGTVVVMTVTALGVGAAFSNYLVADVTIRYQI